MATTSKQHIYEDSWIKIDARAHYVWAREELVRVLPYEWKLLILLVSHKGQVIAKEALLKAVWGQEYTEFSSSDPVKWHIANLRRKMPKDWPLVTVRGFGYRYDG